MIPWNCDALLPTAERFSSEKFRQYVWFFDPHKLGYPQVVELAAFLRTVPILHAKFIWSWKAHGLRVARAVVEAYADDEDVARMHEENVAAQTAEDGLAILRAMQDGGWHRGSVPDVVRMALMDMRSRGMSRQAIADTVGLSHETIRNIDKGADRRLVAVPLGVGLVAQ